MWSVKCQKNVFNKNNLAWILLSSHLTPEEENGHLAQSINSLSKDVVYASDRQGLDNLSIKIRQYSMSVLASGMVSPGLKGSENSDIICLICYMPVKSK